MREFLCYLRSNFKLHFFISSVNYYARKSGCVYVVVENTGRARVCYCERCVLVIQHGIVVTTKCEAGNTVERTTDCN